MGVDDADSKYNPTDHTVTFNVYYYGLDLAADEENDDSHLIGQKESILVLPNDFELVEEE